jgi:hypothetical protein
VRTADCSRHFRPAGTKRRTCRVARTESSASPSCTIVTVVGPPPSGEDWARVVVSADCVRSARTNSSASWVGDAALLRPFRNTLNFSTSCAWFPVETDPPGQLTSAAVLDAALSDEPQPETKREVRTRSASASRPRRRLRCRLRGGAGFARASAKPESKRSPTDRRPSGCSRSRNLLRPRGRRPLRPGTSGRSRMTPKRSGC